MSDSLIPYFGMNNSAPATVIPTRLKWPNAAYPISNAMIRQRLLDTKDISCLRRLLMRWMCHESGAAPLGRYNLNWFLFD